MRPPPGRRPLAVLLIVVALLLSLSARLPRAEPRVVAGDLAITGATVIDVERGVRLPNHTVVVKGDRIAAIGPSATIRSVAATVIDGAGKFVIPGLWDSHAHVLAPEMPGWFLRYGVTGTRHMFSLVGGVDVRASDPANGGPGPRVIAATHLLDGPQTGFPRFLRGNVVLAGTPDAARQGVRDIQRRKNDFLKVYLALPKETYFAATAEAKAIGLPFGGHIPFAVSVADASDAGQLTVEHLDGVAVACSKLRDRFLAERRGCLDAPDPGARQSEVACAAMRDQDPERAKELFAKFVKNGTWHLPNLVQTRAVSRLANRDAVPPAIEKQLPDLLKPIWARTFLPDGGVSTLLKTFTAAELKTRREQFEGEMKLVGQMHRAGVRLLAGTDTPYPLVVPGLSLHEELELLVGAGLTPVEALRTATINPAKCFGREKDLGSVAAGKLADLVVLSADPTRDIRNTLKIDTVICAGRIVGR